MSNTTKWLSALVVVVGALAQTDLAQQFIAAHPAWSAAISAVSALAALFHKPVKQN